MYSRNFDFPIFWRSCWNFWKNPRNPWKSIEELMKWWSLENIQKRKTWMIFLEKWNLKELCAETPGRISAEWILRIFLRNPSKILRNIRYLWKIFQIIWWRFFSRNLWRNLLMKLIGRIPEAIQGQFSERIPRQIPNGTSSEKKNLLDFLRLSLEKSKDFLIDFLILRRIAKSNATGLSEGTTGSISEKKTLPCARASTRAGTASTVPIGSGAEWIFEGIFEEISGQIPVEIY